MVERHPYKVDVIGSSPVFPTNKHDHTFVIRVFFCSKNKPTYNSFRHPEASIIIEVTLTSIAPSNGDGALEVKSPCISGEQTHPNVGSLRFKKVIPSSRGEAVGSSSC